MIKSIYLKNFLLVSEQKINFNEKINAIFGETGSGKSIIFKAFMQLSGQKSDSSLIRKNSDGYLIEAVFNNNDEIISFLNKHDIEIESDLTISRKLSDKSIIRINGEKVTLKILQEFSSILFDFTNQNEVSEFNNPNYLLELVNQNVDLTNYKNLFIEYKKLKNDLDELYEKELNKDEKLEILNYRIKQLKKIDIFNSVEMYEKYLEEFEEMKLLEENSNLHKQLISDMNNTVKSLNAVSESIVKLKDNELIDELDPYISVIEDLDFKVNQKFNIDFSQKDYDEMANKINDFKTLMRSYKLNEEELINYKNEIEQEISILEAIELDIKLLRKKYNELVNDLEKDALKISEQRQKNAKKLSKEIEILLTQLNMKHVKVEFNFVDCSFKNNGIDEVSLYISTNNQNTLQSIDKIASGGELSRILLAIKSVSNINSSSTIFFDEIDSGVSGNVASLMANILVKLSEKNQIIFISHLPQMISVANEFLYVEKKLTSDNAISSITPVYGDDLIFKLAYFIQNGTPSEESKKVITQLLKEVK